MLKVPLALSGSTGTRTQVSVMPRPHVLSFRLCTLVTMQLLDSQHLRAGRILGDHLQPLFEQMGNRLRAELAGEPVGLRAPEDNQQHSCHPADGREALNPSSSADGNARQGRAVSSAFSRG